MHPRFIPTVEQFRPYRDHPRQPGQIRALLAMIAGTDDAATGYRRPARGRLRPPAEFRD